MLRRLSIHLWAFAQYYKEIFLFGCHLAPQKLQRPTNEVFAGSMRALADTAEALVQATPQHLPQSGVRRLLWTWRLYIRSWYYLHIAFTLAVAPREWQTKLDQDDLQRIIRFGELALHHAESAGLKVVGVTRRWTKFGAKLGEQFRLTYHAMFHVSIASLYLRVNVGDLSRNLEASFRHYRRGAQITEEGNQPLLSIYAACIWAALGTAYVKYPTERRTEYAQLAIESLLKAKGAVSPYRAPTEASAPVMWRIDPSVPRLTMAKYLMCAMIRTGFGMQKMVFRGVPDSFVMATVLPLLMIWVDWQLGVAYRQLGQTNKAVEYFTLVLEGPTKGIKDFRSLHAPIEVAKGYAYLEAMDCDRSENLELASESFRNAFAGCVENGFVRWEGIRTYALALLGDAHAYFALRSLEETILADWQKRLPILINQLRVATRITRTLVMPELTQETLFLLAKAYELQRDYIHAFRALALASRVSDRMQRRARTPRLTRYLVGQEAALTGFLVRMTLLARASTERPQKERLGTIVPLHYALRYAEKGKTSFLAAQLRSLNVLPEGAADRDVSELFEQRRLWHEAELRLLEQESNPSSGSRALITLRERRSALESDYLAELGNIRSRFADPHYDPDQPVLAARFDEIWEIVREFSRAADTALVEYYFTDQDLVAFVLLPSSLRCVYLGISLDELGAIAEHWYRGYSVREMPKHWERGYLLQALHRLKSIVEKPAKTIQEWEQDTGRRIQRLIIVPHRFLHLLPLHAIELSTGQLWGDSVSIQYAPSATLLSQLMKSGKRKDTQCIVRKYGHNGGKVVGIAGSPPGGSPTLLFNREEARTVVETCGGELVEGPNATPHKIKQAIKDASYVHFACHGTFDNTAPLESALELAVADREGDTGSSQSGRLTLGEIFRDLRLSHAPVVVLSACDTGLAKIEEKHEEYIGLPAGFLYAGARTVISTLWRISDVATWLLMRSFARELAAGSDVTASLGCAQHELRGLSRDSVISAISQAVHKETDVARREQMIKEGQQLPSDEFPFAGPYWWAGFTVNGL